MNIKPNIGFSDEDQILYIFKGYGAKNLVRNFRIKVGHCGD